MPSTFAGNYIKEPSDLRSVCTEADIIAVCDDAGVARGLTTFEALDSIQLAAIVGVMDSLIPAEEATLESYARRRGYAVPLYPVDADVVSVIARLLWIAMRQRAKGLTADAAEMQRKAIRDGSLKDIADGRLLLTAIMAPGAAAGSTIYSFSDAVSRDETGTVTRLSRRSLEGF